MSDFTKATEQLLHSLALHQLKMQRVLSPMFWYVCVLCAERKKMHVLLYSKVTNKHRHTDAHTEHGSDLLK